MTRARALRLARRLDLGEVLLVARTYVPPWLLAMFWLPALALVWVNVSDPLVDPLPAVLIVGPFVLLCGVAPFVIAGDRLVVARRGILLGRFWPGFHPYVLRWEQIDSATIRVVTPGRAFARLTARQNPFALRSVGWPRYTLSFAGPPLGLARTRGPVAVPAGTRVTPSLWSFGIGRDASAVVAALEDGLAQRLTPDGAALLRRDLAAPLVLGPGAPPEAIPGNAPGR